VSPRLLPLAASAALMLAAGCSGGAGDRALPSAPVSGAPAGCTRVCNADYDTCMDRFNANPTPNRPDVGSGSPESMLGGGGHCSDELQSCLRSCPG
jgi:hypothetical protein